MSTRKQLTLFLKSQESEDIERLRERFNIEQYNLIRSHITLCRENEIQDLDSILNVLDHLNYSSFKVSLGLPERFYEGKGVFVPIIDSTNQLSSLRSKLHLSNKKFEPHITLMHPRNSTCTDDSFHAICKTALPETVTISEISLIEQEIGKKWHTLKKFKLSEEA